MRMAAPALALPLLLLLLLSAAGAEDYEFPEDFFFGVASAAYQVEGAWNLSGKGENIWDRTTHLRPELILNGSNGDVACDSYHKYMEDVQLIKNVGFSVYRLSISWSRLLPTGAIDKINEDGIRYYNDVIDELLDKNITPMVTLYHWDLPQPLMDLGGIPNPVFIDYFLDYAELAFSLFGDRVKLWVTFNEPMSICEEGWGLAEKAPAYYQPAWADYQCSHILLLAHAKAYHLYNDTFRATQNGSVGIILSAGYGLPKDENSTDDVAAAERAMQFTLGWYGNPIFGADGDYPVQMREGVLHNSMLEGLKRSRLPVFTAEEIASLKGSADFLGINTYTGVESTYVAPNTTYTRSKMRDGNYSSYLNDEWPTTIASWMSVTPWNMRKLMQWIQSTYGNITVIITENGYPTYGDLDDYDRMEYFREYLNSLLDAIVIDEANVIGYIVWSLMDNFEWFYGYVHRFGLYHVDFEDVNRTRTPRLSVQFFQELISTKRVPNATIVNSTDTTSTTESSSSSSSATWEASARSSAAVVLCGLLAGLFTL